MTTPSIGSVSTTNDAATSAQAPKTTSTGLGDDLNAFLRLLTTQLQNQDPLSPLDTNQFTQQLVSFSQVEQAIKQNDQLKSLIALTSNSALTALASLVGKKVELDSPSMGMVDGNGIDFTYTLPRASKETSLTITDSGGNIVWTGAGDLTAGRHAFTWDGKDSNGNTVADGTYTLEVGALGLDDSVMTAEVTTFGTVDGAVMKEGEASLAFGAFEIPTTKLVAVRN
jgi:flagellar basal-body rod modification protein FlgD